MAIAKITYNLEEAEDLLEFKQAVASPKMAHALFQLLYNTKKGIGYEMEGKEMDKYDALELVFDRIHDIMREYNINIDDLNN